MSVIIGIDPGLSGAIAFYDHAAGALDVADIPTLEMEKRGKKMRVVDEYAVARLIDDQVGQGNVSSAWIEWVSASPGAGVVSAFRFGDTFGLLRGIIVANFVTLERVTPVVWKRALRVPAAKDGARARASQLFPKHTHLWTRVKDADRAEAAMIAHYGATRQGN